MLKITQDYLPNAQFNNVINKQTHPSTRPAQKLWFNAMIYYLGLFNAQLGLHREAVYKSRFYCYLEQLGLDPPTPAVDLLYCNWQGENAAF